MSVAIPLRGSRRTGTDVSSSMTEALCPGRLPGMVRGSQPRLDRGATRPYCAIGSGLRGGICPTNGHRSRTRTNASSPSSATSRSSAAVEWFRELRDQFLDHLGPLGVLHELRAGLGQRWPHRHGLGMAHRRAHHPHRCLLHVRIGLGVSDRGRPLLVGLEAREAPAGRGTRAGSTSLGLIAIVGSVTYGAALFASTLFSVWELDLGVISFVIDDANANLVHEQFILFSCSSCSWRRSTSSPPIWSRCSAASPSGGTCSGSLSLS